MSANGHAGRCLGRPQLRHLEKAGFASRAGHHPDPDPGDNPVAYAEGLFGNP